MSEERGLCRVAAERVPLPPMAASTTFHWDGVGAVSRSVGPHIGPEPDPPDLPAVCSFTPASWQTSGQIATGRHTRSFLTAEEMGLARSSPPQAIDWAGEAARLTVYLDPGLLPAAARDMLPRMTGELVWVCRREQAQSISLYMHPLLLVHGAGESRQVDRVELVLHLHTSDPLLHHIVLLLKAEMEAEGVPGRLYAEVLTDALVVHLLRRYAACLPPVPALPRGLAPYKLRRTTTYIEQHLEHELSLVELAAVAQTSPAHFARLFKHATGKTPHQYVLSCRIERAKRLLTETPLPLGDISYQVGCTDQSHFTALFRKHMGITPKAYRDATQRG